MIVLELLAFGRVFSSHCWFPGWIRVKCSLLTSWVLRYKELPHLPTATHFLVKYSLYFTITHNGEVKTKHFANFFETTSCSALDWNIRHPQSSMFLSINIHRTDRRFIHTKHMFFAGFYYINLWIFAFFFTYLRTHFIIEFQRHTRPIHSHVHVQVLRVQLWGEDDSFDSIDLENFHLEFSDA